MMKNFATEQLGIRLPEQRHGDLHLNDFVDVGVRDNPKRVQLLASKIIPKCHMVDPVLLDQVAAMLAVKTLEEHTGTEVADYEEMVGEFFAIAEGHESNLPALDLGATTEGEFVTVGYADAAVALGFAVARHLRTAYTHSVHQGEEGSISFEEPHSLKSSHYLRPSAVELLDNDKPVLLVDDEITTGRTVLNTIKAINAVHWHKDWYIASIIDTRSPADVVAMEKFAAENGLNITVVALAAGHMEIPEDIFVQADRFKSTCHPPAPLIERKTNPNLSVSVSALRHDSLLRASAGLSPSDLSAYTTVGMEVAQRGAQGRTRLVLGIGEYSYVPLLASLFDASGVKLSMLNKTPLYTHPHERYPIATSAPVAIRKNGDATVEYLYNMERFDEVVVVLPPVMEVEDASIRNGVLDVVSHYTDKIHFIKIYDQEASK